MNILTHFDRFSEHFFKGYKYLARSVTCNIGFYVLDRWPSGAILHVVEVESCDSLACGCSAHPAEEI